MLDLPLLLSVQVHRQDNKHGLLSAVGGHMRPWTYREYAPQQWLAKQGPWYCGWQGTDGEISTYRPRMQVLAEHGYALIEHPRPATVNEMSAAYGIPLLPAMWNGELVGVDMAWAQTHVSLSSWHITDDMEGGHALTS